MWSCPCSCNVAVTVICGRRRLRAGCRATCCGRRARKVGATAWQQPSLSPVVPRQRRRNKVKGAWSQMEEGRDRSRTAGGEGVGDSSRADGTLTPTTTISTRCLASQQASRLRQRLRWQRQHAAAGMEAAATLPRQVLLPSGRRGRGREAAAPRPPVPTAPRRQGRPLWVSFRSGRRCHPQRRQHDRGRRRQPQLPQQGRGNGSGIVSPPTPQPLCGRTPAAGGSGRYDHDGSGSPKRRVGGGGEAQPRRRGGDANAWGEWQAAHFQGRQQQQQRGQGSGEAAATAAYPRAASIDRGTERVWALPPPPPPYPEDQPRRSRWEACRGSACEQHYCRRQGRRRGPPRRRWGACRR